MIIEVNLLPGRTVARRGPDTAALGAFVKRLRGGVQDPYLAAAVASLVIVGGGVAWLHTAQTREQEALELRQAAAVDDSTRYAGVIAARKQAIAERDSVQKQVAIIASIDSTRYVWAHVLDEVSRTLPPYTWLTNVAQTSTAPAPPQAAGGAAPDSTAADSTQGARTGGARELMRFRVVGQTVDIQALTAFMRDLEASPFVQRVQLAKSEAVQVDGKDVTEFTLDGEFEAPERALVRTQSITVPLR